MILFKERYKTKILAGEKWQSRRLWDRPRVRPGSWHLLYTRPPVSGARPFALARVTGLRRQRLGDMTEEEAQAEGCESLGAFLKEFQQIYDGKIVAEPREAEVWVVEFRLAGVLP